MSLTNALRSSSSLLPNVSRTIVRSRALAPTTSAGMFKLTRQGKQQKRHASSAHAISNPTLADIEKRWEGMPPQEQAELWMSLRDRMKVNWSEMTLQEKKAAYYIAFGNHGPRAVPPPGEGWRVAGYVGIGVGVSFAIFVALRMFAGGSPRTMTKEYQEATNEFLRAQNSDPISGLSSEGYKGKGHIQSASKAQ